MPRHDVDLTLIGILNNVSHEINFITQPSPFSCRSDDSARSQLMNHENIDVLTLTVLLSVTLFRNYGFYYLNSKTI